LISSSPWYLQFLQPYAGLAGPGDVEELRHARLDR
jgi:hypothetical protein